MKLNAKEDIEAPIGEVFAALSEFDRLMRMAMRRGAKITTLRTVTPPGAGMRWEVNFAFRGRDRRATIELTRFEPPTGMTFHGVSDGLETVLNVELVPLSRIRTRLAVEMLIKPRTLTAKLLVQSLKLARRPLKKRFRLRIADMARHIEESHLRRA